VGDWFGTASDHSTQALDFCGRDRALTRHESKFTISRKSVGATTELVTYAMIGLEETRTQLSHPAPPFRKHETPVWNG